MGDDSPIEFEINGNGGDYIDLANGMLYVRAKVTWMNGNNIANDTPVGPVNLFLHSLFFAGWHFVKRNAGDQVHEYLCQSGDDRDASQLW